MPRIVLDESWQLTILPNGGANIVVSTEAIEARSAMNNPNKYSFVTSRASWPEGIQPAYHNEFERYVSWSTFPRVRESVVVHIEHAMLDYTTISSTTNTNIDTDAITSSIDNATIAVGSEHSYTDGNTTANTTADSLIYASDLENGIRQGSNYQPMYVDDDNDDNDGSYNEDSDDESPQEDGQVIVSNASNHKDVIDWFTNALRQISDIAEKRFAELYREVTSSDWYDPSTWWFRAIAESINRQIQHVWLCIDIPIYSTDIVIGRIISVSMVDAGEGMCILFVKEEKEKDNIGPKREEVTELCVTHKQLLLMCAHILLLIKETNISNKFKPGSYVVLVADSTLNRKPWGASLKLHRGIKNKIRYHAWLVISAAKARDEVKGWSDNYDLRSGKCEYIYIKVEDSIYSVDVDIVRAATKKSIEDAQLKILADDIKKRILSLEIDNDLNKKMIAKREAASKLVMLEKEIAILNSKDLDADAVNMARNYLTAKKEVTNIEWVKSVDIRFDGITIIVGKWLPIKEHDYGHQYVSKVSYKIVANIKPHSWASFTIKFYAPSCGWQYHPHIATTTHECCWGPYGQQIRDAVSSYDVYMLAYICVDFLKNIQWSNSYGGNYAWALRLVGLWDGEKTIDDLLHSSRIDSAIEKIRSEYAIIRRYGEDLLDTVSPSLDKLRKHVNGREWYEYILNRMPYDR